MSGKNGSTTLQFWAHVADALISGQAKSVAQFAKDQIITPSVAVEASLVSNPILIDGLHTINGILAAYIIQAATRKLSINNIETTRLLHSLSTNRSVTGSAIVGGSTIGAIAGSMESLHGDYLQWGTQQDGFSLEALERDDKRSATIGKDIGEQFTQSGNLGVGRIVRIEVEAGGNKTDVPLMVQFRTQIASADPIVNLLTTGVKKETAKQRIIRFMAGELHGWRDVVMLDDVIKVDRQLRRADNGEDGIFRRVLEERRKRGSFLSLLSLNPHINELNNIYVISKNSFDRIQQQVGNLTRSTVKRDELFERSGAIFMAVIDPEYDSMTLYTHSFDGGAELTSRMMKTMGRGNDIDIMDIFKQFQSSSKLVF